MKKTLLLLFLSTALFSCESEYEERLAEAQGVRIKIEQIKRLDEHESNSGLMEELEELHEEITFLSKVSGNEEKFLEDLFN
jgi:hypothetical protein